jgi:hypothetical protein
MRFAAKRPRPETAHIAPAPITEGSTDVAYLTAHLAYLESEVGKYADTDVVHRIKQRIKATKQRIKEIR